MIVRLGFGGRLNDHSHQSRVRLRDCSESLTREGLFIYVLYAYGQCQWLVLPDSNFQVIL